MPAFLPFPALRFSPELAPADVLAPPYDVLSAADVDALGARSERNIVHLDVPTDYARAAQSLRDWVEDGSLVRDPSDSFTIYRTAFVDGTGAERETVGVLGALAVGAPDEVGVLPHERTTPKASTDRLDLTRATGANLSPVWGLSLAAGLSKLLREPGERLFSVTLDGVTHTAERVADPGRVQAIADLVATDDVLIADGHHRYGVARQYLAERPDAAGARHTLAYVAELAPEQLAIDAIHRLYPSTESAQLKAALATCFELEPAPTPGDDTLATLTDRGVLMLLTGEDRFWLVPKDGAFDGVRQLDGAWLEHALAELNPAVQYQHGLNHVVDAVDAGASAVLIRPTGIEEITRTAREGLLMPPKSTFFTPKLLTGIVIRQL